jgi:hypothetical protein
MENVGGWGINPEKCRVVVFEKVKEHGIPVSYVIGRGWREQAATTDAARSSRNLKRSTLIFSNRREALFLILL